MNHLKEVRKSKIMSQWSLAQQSRVHQSRISLFENALIRATEDEKQKLAKALGVNVAEIFGDEKIPIDPEENSQSKESLSTGK